MNVCGKIPWEGTDGDAVTPNKWPNAGRTHTETHTHTRAEQRREGASWATNLTPMAQKQQTHPASETQHGVITDQ